MASLLTRFIALIANVLSSLLGSLRWSPPKWISWTGSKIFGGLLLTTIAYLRFLEQKPKRFLAANFIFIATLLGAFFTYRWYVNLPPPATLKISLKDIPATNLELANIIPNPLIVEFSGSAASIDKVGKEIFDGINIIPKVNGGWRWASDSRLEFWPQGDWEVGQQYKVTLSKKLFPRHILIERYNFEFSSPKFIPKVQSGEFYQDPTDAKIKQVVVKVSFTHPVDKSDLERRVSARMRVDPIKSFEDPAVRKLGFKIIYNEKATEAFIRTDTFAIPERDGEVLVNVSDNLHSSRAGKGSESALARTVHIPGVDNFFKISAVKQNIVTNEKSHTAERVVTISSTAGVALAELQRNVEVLLIPHDKNIYQAGIEQYEQEENSEASAGEDEYSDEDSDSESESAYIPDLPEDSCPWTSAGQVSDQALSKAQKLNVTWIESDREFASDNSFSFDADVGRCFFIRIKKGTKSFGDYPLTDNKNFLQVVQPFSQDLKITDKGSLLALSGEKKIGVMARGLSAVKFTLFRVLPNALHHLGTQAYQYDSSFAQPNFNYNFGPENISEVFESVTTLPITKPGQPQYSVFDFGSYLAGSPEAERGLFFLRASGFDPKTKYASGPQVERLVLVSNLGFILKNFQDDRKQLYVMSTSDQVAVAAATVEVLGKNGQPIFSSLTDEMGKVDLPSFRDFRFEKYPTVFVVRKDGDLSFMPYDRSDRKLNFSRFDVGGLYTEKESESLQAYLFSDRGIYRPGETAHIGLAIKSLNWMALSNNVPFEISVIDPRGIEINKQKLSFPADGFQEFNFAVADSALTGNYQVQLSLIRPKRSSYLLGTTTVRVEEFLPDRLKINASLSKPKLLGWLTPEDLQLRVGLRNLYGTPAEGNTIKGRLRLSPYFPRFTGWEDFSFFDPMAAKNSFVEDLGQILTDANGEAVLDLGLERFDKATFQLSAFVEGLEQEGGRSVSTSVDAIISPQTFLLGWKPGGDLSFIKKGFAQRVKLIALGQDLQPLATNNLVLEKVETRYVSVLTKQPGGSLAYQSIPKKIIKETRSFEIPKDGVELILASEEPGTFHYEIRNAHGLVLNTIPYNIVGDADLNASMDRTAELQIKLNKRDFAPEEEIEFEVQAPYVGMGLITIERDQVYAAAWFKTNTNASIQKIRVPKGLEGNGYLNVSFVRSLDSQEIFTSPLSYGVEAFSISKEQRSEPIQLAAPNQVVPGQKLSITASTKNPTRAVVYAVDEGILQVARYKTPDPLSHFFRKRALEVQTQQIVDLLLPEYRWIRETLAAGGDEDALLGKHRNPFKRKGQAPVIFWSGIVALSSEPSTFDIEVPDYFNGSIKVFAVAVSDQRVGVSEKQVSVQGDIVLSPNAPLFAAPGDEFSVNVVVANTKLPEGEFNVSLQTDARLQLLSEPKVSLDIPTTKDAVASFQLKALSELGTSDLIFRAEGQGASARYTIDLSIRPASARLTTLQTGVLKRGILGAQEQLISLDRILYNAESERNISFSTLPIGLAKGLAAYVENYPHGCTEQLTSQAFPSLLLSKDPAFAITPEQVQKTMARTFALLGSRQREDGSFTFWPGESSAENWISLHVGRFLLEAKDHGFSPPKSLLENSNSYLRSIASNSPESLSLMNARNRAYAIYLLTRAGVVATNHLQSLREDLEKRGPKGWKSDIVSLLMASTYKLLQLDKEASDFSKQVKVKFEKENDDEFLYSGSAGVGLSLDLLARHFPDQARALKADYFEQIADELSKNSYSTLISAQLILGLSQFQKLVPEVTIIESSELLGSSDTKNFAPLMLPQTKIPTLRLSEELTALKLIGKSEQNIYYQISQSGFDKPESLKAQANGIEISREYRDNEGQAISKAKLGDDISVVINIRSKDGLGYIGNIAVTDLLPTGFEISGGSQGLNSKTVKVQNPWIPDFVDAREDRALLYGTVSSSSQQFTYKVKAISKGNFVVPPIQAEAMYDPKISAIAAGGNFIIE